MVFYPNSSTFGFERGIGEGVLALTLRCRSNSMRFSSGRPAIVGRRLEVTGKGQSDDHHGSLLYHHHPWITLAYWTGSSTCLLGESRFGLKSLDSRSLGSWKPLTAWFSIKTHRFAWLSPSQRFSRYFHRPKLTLWILFESLNLPNSTLHFYLLSCAC